MREEHHVVIDEERLGRAPLGGGERHGSGGIRIEGRAVPDAAGQGRFESQHAERVRLTDERRRAMIQRRNAYEDLWRNALNDGIASGQLRQDADVRLAGIGILSACNWFTQWYRPDGPMTVDQIADRFIALFLQGVQAPEAAA